MLRMMLVFYFTVVGGEKVFPLTNKFCVGLKLDDGLGAQPKGY